MQNDPIQHLNLTKPYSLIDVVLANTYFATPTLEGGQLVPREQARALIKETIINLWKNRDTKHIIEALGSTILKEKGEIFICNGSVSGVYDHFCSIFSSLSIVKSGGELRVNPESLGALVHEASHFIFNRILRNSCSPVKTEEEARKLDQILEQDRNHRSRKKLGLLDGREAEIRRRWFDFQLDSSQVYFGGFFDQDNPQHLDTMRVEAIVRIMEQITAGYSHSEVRGMAPRLYDYYFDHCKPMIEQYTKTGAVS